MNKSILALAIGALGIGMTEFTMMGVLENFANDLAISIPQAGHFISIYALGVFIGAPVLVMLTSKHPPKKVLMFFMMLFFVFNLMFTIAPNYISLYIARFFSGLPHGAYFGVGTVVAAYLAPKGKEASYISYMFAGLSFANLAGVPLGTFIAQLSSWRISFGLIALIGLLAILAIHFWVPTIVVDKNVSLKSQLSFFKTWKAWTLIVMISIGTAGLFAWISYISPLVTKVGRLPESQLPIIMILVGMGMFIGNLVGGKLSDRISPNKAAITSFTLMCIILIINYFMAGIGVMNYVLSFLTGLIAFTVGSPIQMMLINNAKGAETLAASAGQASFNLGNALGAYLGGLPIIFGYGYQSPLVVGAIMAISGALIAVIFYKLNNKTNHV
ncbi:MFS transporter [Vaginella massiliensis]|uniref:MFS transporter n=1 Tax=Vaginella massiliensis TaxID=1816680 RepID=UPI0037513EC2